MRSPVHREYHVDIQIDVRAGIGEQVRVRAARASPPRLRPRPRTPCPPAGPAQAGCDATSSATIRCTVSATRPHPGSGPRRHHVRDAPREHTIHVGDGQRGSASGSMHERSTYLRRRGRCGRRKMLRCGGRSPLDPPAGGALLRARNEGPTPVLIAHTTEGPPTQFVDGRPHLDRNPDRGLVLVGRCPHHQRRHAGATVGRAALGARSRDGVGAPDSIGQLVVTGSSGGTRLWAFTG